MKREYDFSQGKRGSVVSQKGKTRITIYLDNEVVATFRTLAEQAGTGYQTMINQTLRDYLNKANTTVDEETLRRVLREELQAVE